MDVSNDYYTWSLIVIHSATFVSEFPATDLVGRVVFNLCPDGVEFLVIGLTLYTWPGKVFIEIVEVDADADADADADKFTGEPVTIASLKGWEESEPRLPHLLANVGR